MSDVRDLIDAEGLDPDEEGRLQRVHELLVEAGPPAELPPAPVTPGSPPAGEIVPFPIKRRPTVLVLVAAAVAAAAFGAGYLIGHSKAKTAPFAAGHVVSMKPTHAGASGLAVLKLAKPDSVGNWAMLMTVSGLPQQPQRAAYYELWLTRNGAAVAPCGAFRVHGSTTTVRFTVPYKLSRFDGWVVTIQQPGRESPGPAVLTT
jgi:Anti-sigma-K factor rskA, C-terminal